MKRVLAVGLITATVLVFAVTRGNDDQRKQQQSETSPPLPTSVGANLPREARLSPFPLRSADRTAPQAERVILAAEERREGEWLPHYDGRMASLALYRKFAARARLSPEQEQQLMRVLADAAENYRRIRADAIGAGRDEMFYIHDVEFSRDFSAEMFTAVDEILDDEQMRLFEKYFPLPYLIAAFPPVEVVPPE